MRKKVGQISEAEKLEIQQLFNKKRSLEELFRVILSGGIPVKNEDIYNKLVDEYTVVTAKFQDWWDRSSLKYNWEGREKGTWQVDFDTNDIYLS